MHIAGRKRDVHRQRLLWGYVERRVLFFHSLTDADARRMQVLMDKYADRPMDLADASLVATAEARTITRVFTLDSDFYHYKIHDRLSFEVIP